MVADFIARRCPQPTQANYRDLVKILEDSFDAELIENNLLAAVGTWIEPVRLRRSTLHSS